MDKIKQNDSYTEMSVKYRTGKIVIKSKINYDPTYVLRDHKILRNIHLTFGCLYCSQKQGEEFAKFCGLLRIYELE